MLPPSLLPMLQCSALRMPLPMPFCGHRECLTCRHLLAGSPSPHARRTSTMNAPVPVRCSGRRLHADRRSARVHATQREGGKLPLLMDDMISALLIRKRVFWIFSKTIVLAVPDEDSSVFRVVSSVFFCTCENIRAANISKVLKHRRERADHRLQEG